MELNITERRQKAEGRRQKAENQTPILIDLIILK
jgi:hypothetical protein